MDKVEDGGLDNLASRFGGSSKFFRRNVADWFKSIREVVSLFKVPYSTCSKTIYYYNLDLVHAIPSPGPVVCAAAVVSPSHFNCGELSLGNLVYC